MELVRRDDADLVLMTMSMMLMIMMVLLMLSIIMMMLLSKILSEMRVSLAR